VQGVTFTEEEEQVLMDKQVMMSMGRAPASGAWRTTAWRTTLARAVLVLAAVFAHGAVSVAAELASGSVGPAAARSHVGPACWTDCTPRIGVVAAFGAEADILLARTSGKRAYLINGKVFTAGVLRGNHVVIVLSGVSIVNAAMNTQRMLDHFRVTHLLMSGIAGGLNPSNHVGDVSVAHRWALPLEAFWARDGEVPSPCGAAAELACLGLKIAPAEPDGHADFAGTGLFMRQHHVVNETTGPAGEFKFMFDVDPEMLSVAQIIRPALQRCGDKKPDLCVPTQPELHFGGTGISSSVFLANPQYRDYLFRTLDAQVVDMETAAVAQVAYANRIPFIAFRSISDLAGGDDIADVSALFGSGLAEANEARVTLAFLDAWAARGKAKQANTKKGLKP
jgi:adenosylhomocysteine nucleosidase